jgi:hypothetical protein
MKQRIAEWYNFCGVDVREADVLDNEPSVKLGMNRYVCLPFLNKIAMIMEIDGSYHYSSFPSDYNSAALTSYKVKRTEGSYYLEGTSNKFPVYPLTEDVLENELNPIPLERRLERDAVMAQYSGPVILPRFGNIQWGDW